MIISLKQETTAEQLENLLSWFKGMGMETHLSQGKYSTLVGLIGDTAAFDIGLLEALDIVDTVKRIQEPYKAANRKFHPLDTIVSVGANVKVGGGNFAMMAGPCSVESEEQICLIAKKVKAAGANILRGGAYKPRSSPYAFQGLGSQGIKLLPTAKKESGLPIVTEIMDISQLHYFNDVDLIQVGARNMQNFELLRELGKVRKPILLKRGLSNTIEELLMSAEYIMSGGNSNVILCERGIRTFETVTRNTLDISAVPVVQGLSHLPIIIDPSHATGTAKLVKPMAMAAAACGADGLIIEVHNDPPHALCDGQQSLTFDAFEDVSKAVQAVLPFASRSH